MLREGQPKRNIGVLLDGLLEMYETDADGCRSIVGTVRPQESFALVFAFANVERHPATVVARTDSTILVIPLARVMPQGGMTLDDTHRRFLDNLLREVSETAWTLRSRAFILSRRSTEDRLMTYLRERMHAEGASAFDIPFDRQALADFLCVDRSALSTVIGKLARRGVLKYRKNHFELTDRANV